MTPQLFLVYVLAVWSITRLLIADTIAAPLRKALRRVTPGDDLPEVLGCFWCLSMWVALGVLGALDLAGLSVPAWWWLIAPPAARLLTGLGNLTEDILGALAGYEIHDDGEVS